MWCLLIRHVSHAYSLMQVLRKTAKPSVTVAVFNLMGQEMMRLDPGELSAGHHTFTIDGSSWSSGLYFVRVQAGHHSDTQRILMMK